MDTARERVQIERGRALHTSESRLDRRNFVKVAAAGFVIAISPALLKAREAEASVTWCRSDPTVLLNGTRVQVWVAIPQEDQPDVDGPIMVNFKAPWGVTQELIYVDEGFNGHGETVRLTERAGRIAQDGSFPITVRVKVPVSGRLGVPTRVELIPDNGDMVYVEGTNGLVVLKTRVVGAW